MDSGPLSAASRVYAGRPPHCLSETQYSPPRKRPEHHTQGKLREAHVWTNEFEYRKWQLQIAKIEDYLFAEEWIARFDIPTVYHLPKLQPETNYCRYYNFWAKKIWPLAKVENHGDWKIGDSERNLDSGLTVLAMFMSSYAKRYSRTCEHPSGDGLQIGWK